MNKSTPKNPSPGSRWCEHGQHWHIPVATYICGPDAKERLEQMRQAQEKIEASYLSTIPVVTSFYLSDDIEPGDHFKAAQIDYQVLLKKYIEYIKDVEGTDYIVIHDHRFMCDVKFTEEEWQELERLAELERPDGQNATP